MLTVKAVDAGCAPSGRGHGRGIRDRDVDIPRVDHIGSGNQRHELRPHSMNAVARGLPFHSTKALEREAEPFTPFENRRCRPRCSRE